MYLDQNIVRRKIEIVEEEISFLKDMQNIPFQEFMADKRNLKAVCRSFQNSIQAFIDLGNHIVSSLNLGKPEVYEDIPVILAQNQILSESFKEKFIKMVRFRNFLVHEYDRIDPSRIYEYLQENLKDLEEGLKLIAEFLSSFS